MTFRLSKLVPRLAFAGTTLRFHTSIAPWYFGGGPQKKYRNQRSDLLPSLFKLGLLPFVEQLQFRGAFSVIFDSKNTRYLRAMVNLQTLTIGDLNFSKFPAGFGKHLGHFASTLRSVSLSWPEGTRRQLLDFFRLFPKLDDIEISCCDARRDAYEKLDNKIVPISGGWRGVLFGGIGNIEGRESTQTGNGNSGSRSSRSL